MQKNRTYPHWDTIAICLVIGALLYWRMGTMADKLVNQSVGLMNAAGQVEQSATSMDDQLVTLRKTTDEILEKSKEFSDGSTDWKDIVHDLDLLLQKQGRHLKSVELRTDKLLDDIDALMNTEPDGADQYHDDSYR